MPRAKQIIENLLPLEEDEAFLRSLMPLAKFLYITETADPDVMEPEYTETGDEPEMVAPELAPGAARLGSRKHGDHRPAEITQKLVDDNVKLAYAIANQYSNTPADRQEVVTQALVALDRAARYFGVVKGPNGLYFDEERFGGEESNMFGAFAARIIRNELNRYFKDEAEIRTHEFTDLDASAHQGDEGEDEGGETGKDMIADPRGFGADNSGRDMDTREMYNALHRAIKNLNITDPKIKEALRLHFWDDKTYREIAAELAEEPSEENPKGYKVSHVTVGHWMNKVLFELRREMRKTFADEVPPDEEVNPATGRPNKMRANRRG